MVAILISAFIVCFLPFALFNGAVERVRRKQRAFESELLKLAERRQWELRCEQGRAAWSRALHAERFEAQLKAFEKLGPGVGIFVSRVPEGVRVRKVQPWRVAAGLYSTRRRPDTSLPARRA